MNANAYDSAFARLKKSKFRSRFHLSDSDRKYIADKGIDTIRRHCEDFIRTCQRTGEYRRGEENKKLIQRSGVAKRHPGVEMRNPRGYRHV